MNELRETERCPNCGKVCYAGECHYSSSVTTSWGGSTLYGVCKGCAERHSKQDIAVENNHDNTPVAHED